MRPQVRAIGASSNLGRRQAVDRAGCAQRVEQEAGDRHLADAAGHRRYGSCNLQRFGKGDVADQTILAACASQTA